MNLVLVGISTVLAISMFFLKSDYKMMLMWFYLMCLRMFPEIPTLGVLINIPMCFFLSEFRNIIYTYNCFRGTWLAITVPVICISMVVLFFASPHYCKDMGIVGGVSIFVFELVKKYFFIFYALICVSGMKSMRLLLNVTTFSIILLTVFGVWNLLAGHPVFVEFIYRGQDTLSHVQEKILNDGFGADRMRVHSMFKFAFDYGYICLVSLLLGLYGLKERIVINAQCWVIIGCALFGILVCRCRTVYVCTIAALIVFFMMAYEFKRRFFIIVTIALFAVVLYNTFPVVHDAVYLIGTAFDRENPIDGSNLEGRQNAYKAAISYAQNHLLFGNGNDFFSVDLGYAQGELEDTDLAGLEGVMMALLIERGIVGIVAYLVFYLSLAVQLYKMRRIDSVASACCCSILVSYFLFANFTGELLSVAPTLFIAGAFLKLMLLEQEENISEPYEIPTTYTF